MKVFVFWIDDFFKNCIELKEVMACTQSYIKNKIKEIIYSNNTTTIQVYLFQKNINNCFFFFFFSKSNYFKTKTMEILFILHIIIINYKYI